MAGKPCSLKIRESETEEDVNEYNFTRNYLSNNKSKEVQSNVLLSERSDSEESESDDYSKDNEEDSLETFDPDYNLQYEIDNFEIDTEKENDEEKKLIDSLADSNGGKEIPEVELLNPAILARHRPSFEVLQQSLLNNSECTAPASVIITVLTCEPNMDSDFCKMIYNYQVIYDNFIKQLPNFK